MPPRRAASTAAATRKKAAATTKKRAVVESSDEGEGEEQHQVAVKKEQQESDNDEDDDDSDTVEQPVKKGKATATTRKAPAKAPARSSVNNNTNNTRKAAPKRGSKAKVEPVEQQETDNDEEVSTAQPARREPSESASSMADQTFQDAQDNSNEHAEQQEEDIKPPPPGQGAPATREDASDSASSRASSPAPSTPAANDDDAEPVLPSSQPAIAAPEDDEDDLLQATIQPAPIAPAKVVLQPVVVDEGPKKRLVIHKLVLVNFKSYAGRQEIGPFHKSFSSIVGPNGSGKSNTIDALLFVFGFKATKMRQGKLSELIHNSEGTEDIDSCSVEVWFREIIDLPGPDDYEIVPNSTLVVAREASRNNSSKYTINKKGSTYKEVQTLLKGRGIDLDHKRFLILQGEVESIAQMKPKAPNEHEDGLLEYLEDIIGTSSYKEPIADYLKQVDELNEQRTEKTNRVKLVEREKSALEAAKKEADSYLRDQNELIHRQNELYQLYQHTYQHNITVATEDVTSATAALEREQSEQAGIRAEVQELENEHTTLLNDVNQLEKHMTEVSKELIAFEKEDVQMQEKRKHLSTKLKKLKKSITDDSHAKSEASSSFKNYSEDIEKLRDELGTLEKNLAKEEAELEKICDGLKDKTSVFTRQIDTLQTDLQPWLDKVATKKGEINLKKNEMDLLKEKSESVKRNLDEAETTEKEVKNANEELEERLDGYSKEKLGVEKMLGKLKTELEKITTQDTKARTTASAARAKVEEAKASQAASRSKGDVLSSLTKLKDQGRLNDFYGRLGNLGRIDDKYDVAISTACGALDNLVCETVAGGQACLEVLRRNNLGRATILCLKALNKRDLKPLQTPENVPRLFDLVTPKDPIFAPAFYQVLQNTLVADNLAQANRIAFGGTKRWRVVTLDGKLIDVSGTMSGGGNRVARGGMSSKFSSDEEATPEAIARLEKDTAKAEDTVKVLSEEKMEKEREYNELQRKIPEIEMNISKTEMAVRAGKKRIEEAQKRILELKGQNKQPQGDDVKRIASLEKDIQNLTDELWALEEKRDKIQSEIKSLQDKILEVGGVRLRSQQVKVEGIKEMSDHANDQLTKAEVGKAKAEKDLVKLEKNLKVNALAVEEMEEDLAALEKSIKEKSNALEHVRKNVEDAKEVLEEKKEELNEMKALLDEKQTEMNKFRVKEAELAEKVKAAKATLAENTKSLNAVIKMLEKLELHDIEEDDDDEEEQAARDPEQQQAEKPANVLQVLAEEDLERLNAGALKGQIAVLEERIQQAKPNLAVLKEYKRREKEFLERAQELERVTQERDATKQKHDDMRKQRLEEFMVGFQIISMKLKEMYQMITMGGNAELELVDSLDPFSEGIIFSVMPPKKSWKNISNLSGGEKTLSSLALVFALHVYKPTPLYFMDEIDAALDFRNVSIVGHYLKERTKNAQFIIISLRNNCFELAARLVGIYKVNNRTRSVVIDNHELSQIEDTPALVR